MSHGSRPPICVSLSHVTRSHIPGFVPCALGLSSGTAMRLGRGRLSLRGPLIASSAGLPSPPPALVVACPPERSCQASAQQPGCAWQGLCATPVVGTPRPGPALCGRRCTVSSLSAQARTELAAHGLSRHPLKPMDPSLAAAKLSFKPGDLDRDKAGIVKTTL